MKSYLSSFDKLRIIPQISSVKSRSQCNTRVCIGGIYFDLPLMGASMHSLVNQSFINAMETNGSGVVQPRNTFLFTNRPMYSVSMENALPTIETLMNTFEDGFLIFIEIAHGGLWGMANIIDKIKSKYPDQWVVGGTVDNYQTAKFLEESGYDAILINVGNGAVCTTTNLTGVGLPIVASLLDIQDNGGLTIPIIVAGGVDISGFVKSIALGADMVMSGRLFKNCKDTLAGETNLYYGEASEKHKGNRNHVEGKIEVVESKETVYDVLKLAKESLQSAMSYSNSYNIVDFQRKVQLAILD